MIRVLIMTKEIVKVCTFNNRLIECLNLILRSISEKVNIVKELFNCFVYMWEKMSILLNIKVGGYENLAY